MPTFFENLRGLMNVEISGFYRFNVALYLKNFKLCYNEILPQIGDFGGQNLSSSAIEELENIFSTILPD